MNEAFSSFFSQKKPQYRDRMPRGSTPDEVHYDHKDSAYELLKRLHTSTGPKSNWHTAATKRWGDSRRIVDLHNDVKNLLAKISTLDD